MIGVLLGCLIGGMVIVIDEDELLCVLLVEWLVVVGYVDVCELVLGEFGVDFGGGWVEFVVIDLLCGCLCMVLVVVCVVWL